MTNGSNDRPRTNTHPSRGGYLRKQHARLSCNVLPSRAWAGARRGSVAGTPVGIVFPFSFLISTPENFAITPSLKFSLISVGETLLETSAAGLADVSFGCALAEVASRLIAKTARVPVVIVFRDISNSFLCNPGGSVGLQQLSRLGSQAPRSDTELITPAVITRPGIIVVSRLISVSFVMKVPKRTMIGTVLTTTIKTILVGPFVRVRQLVVEPVVRIITVVFIIVSQCGQHRHAQQ